MSLPNTMQATVLVAPHRFELQARATMLVFGAVGYLLNRYGFPVVPMPAAIGWRTKPSGRHH